MSAPSIIPETTLPDTSSEAREREQRPEVLVRATQESPVTVRLQDEVHDIRDDVRRLATRFDAMEERSGESDRRIAERFDVMDERFDVMDERFDVMDERFDTIKEWTDHLNGWTQGLAGTLNTILGKLDEISSRVGRLEEGK